MQLLLTFGTLRYLVWANMFVKSLKAFSDFGQRLAAAACFTRRSGAGVYDSSCRSCI